MRSGPHAVEATEPGWTQRQWSTPTAPASTPDTFVDAVDLSYRSLATRHRAPGFYRLPYGFGDFTLYGILLVAGGTRSPPDSVDKIDQ